MLASARLRRTKRNCIAQRRHGTRRATPPTTRLACRTETGVPTVIPAQLRLRHPQSVLERLRAVRLIEEPGSLPQELGHHSGETALHRQTQRSLSAGQAATGIDVKTLHERGNGHLPVGLAKLLQRTTDASSRTTRQASTSTRSAAVPARRCPAAAAAAAAAAPSLPSSTHFPTARTAHATAACNAVIRSVG